MTWLCRGCPSLLSGIVCHTTSLLCTVRALLSAMTWLCRGCQSLLSGIVCNTTSLLCTVRALLSGMVCSDADAKAFCLV